MTQRDWQRGDAHTLGVFLNGEEILTRTPYGEQIVDDSFLLLFNAHYESVSFQLPARRFGRGWLLEVDTAYPTRNEDEILLARANVDVTDRSLMVLRRA
jgi:glycogen operon protein